MLLRCFEAALEEFLRNNDKFIIDKEISSKACITETIDGYLKKIKWLDLTNNNKYIIWKSSTTRLLLALI